MNQQSNVGFVLFQKKQKTFEFKIVTLYGNADHLKILANILILLVNSSVLFFALKQTYLNFVGGFAFKHLNNQKAFHHAGCE